MDNKSADAKRISSLTQWKKEFLPELTSNETIGNAIADNHVGAILAQRVLSNGLGQFSGEQKSIAHL